ncbi:F-box protein At3g07870-like [Juglans microcarpa x Juglans regia]|uniref:F-box protein At3g07870-like n=1 Tax=Juglans microcarpa x Juglans regia TaxID=2249226 RepID=UPI001B7EF541|nr:F-box protein At3g07870-like [Juglans microcarpa x Juglans regia]
MVVPTNHIPEDVLTDILSRLPVKSLVRFSQEENHTISLISNKTLDVAAKIDAPREIKFGIIVGSCNGLVCLSQGSVILLWNPATREHNILPTPCIDPRFPNLSIMKISIGFGFHLDDYKVVRIVYFRGLQDGNPVHASRVELYSTSTGSWRMINAVVPCDIEQLRCGVILKGVPYWLGFGPFWPNTIFGPGEPRRDEFVLSFDMGKEVFGLLGVPEPDAKGSCHKYSKKLGAYKGSVALIYYPCLEHVDNFIEFWVMKDNDLGFDECWSKVLRIGPFSSIGIPLGCWNNGVVIWQNDKDELFLYDPFTKDVKKLSTHGATKFSACVSTYVESLLPVINTGIKDLY